MTSWTAGVLEDAEATSLPPTPTIPLAGNAGRVLEIHLTRPCIVAGERVEDDRTSQEREDAPRVLEDLGTKVDLIRIAFSA